LHVEETEGWLFKKGHLSSQFQKRWFLLTTEKKLRYFETEKKFKELGVVDLCQATKLGKVTICIEGVDYQGITFTVGTRVWRIYATTEAERDLWHDKILKTTKSLEYIESQLHRLILGVKIAVLVFLQLF